MKLGATASSPFWSAVVCLVVAVACGPHFPRPFNADEMVHIGTGAALADYLTQQNASPEVCDRQSRGPHMGVLRKDHLADLHGRARGRNHPPGRLAGLRQRPAEDASVGGVGDVLRHDGPGVRDAASQVGPRGAASPPAEARGAPPGLPPAPRGPRAARAGDGRPAAAAGGRDGEGEARPLRGQARRGFSWRPWSWATTGGGGPPSPAPALDGFQAAGDEPLLRRFALRLADKALQVEARRRVIRLHIAASKWPEVTAHAPEVEAAVLAAGRYPVDLTQHAPLQGSMDIAIVGMRGVLLRQNVEQQVVTLLADQGPRDRTSAGTLLPELPLRGAVQLSLRGISSPVTLCARPEDLDVTPCVLPRDAHVKTPFVDIDDGGRLHFIEHAHTGDIFAEVRDRPKVSWPFEVAARTVFNLDWPATFEKPADVVMKGAAGGLGPNMRVAAEERAERLFFKVDIGKGPLLVAIERPDSASFSVVTRGANGRPGTPGAPGANGAAGSAGSPGSCPGSPGGPGGNGSPGGPGGAGGPGGPGANGGDALIEVSCASAECQRLGKILERVVRSEGGAGGPGGPGGRGGQGGAGGPGGSGASCTDSQGHYMSVGGGSSGSPGANGASGPKGPDGPPGLPGKVVFAIVK